MQDRKFVTNRWIVKILRAICEQRGIAFSSHSDDWLLEMKSGDNVHRILGYRFDVNNSVAASITQDKVATYQVLAKAKLPAVPHVLVRTRVSHADRSVMRDWQQVVIKPLVGTSGHGVHLYNNIDTAMVHIEQSPIAGWAAAPFVDIQREIRVIMLDGKSLLVYEKLPVEVRGLKMFNLGLGATPINIEADEGILNLAIRAQRELGLRLSTVDIVEDSSGNRQVLEINDSIMMEYYARFSAENKRRAEEVYGLIVEAVMEETR